MTLEAGVRLGPYEILSPLNLAWAGEVYRGRDHEHQRDIAIRVLRVDFAAHPTLRRRFEGDMRAAAALTHPDILDIYDVGTDDHAAYIVSEPFEGETVRALLDRDALSAPAAIRCAVQVARALAAAHRKGIVHRGLTAENVLVAPEGRVTLLGFGLAALAEPDSPVAAAAGRRSDVFALAGFLRQALKGIPRRGLATRQRRLLAWMAGFVLLALAAGLALPRVQSSRQAADEPPMSASPRDTAAPMPSADVPAEPVPRPPEAGAERGSLEEIPASGETSVTVADAAGAAASSREGVTNRAAVDAAVPSAAPAVTVAEPPSTTPVFDRDDRDTASLTMEASVRATEFDLARASNLLRAAAERGDASTQVALLYVRGLQEARDAFRRGGAAETLASVREAIASLEAIAKGRPGSAEIARLTLHAAAAAAQSEHAEMRLYLETAIRMESAQRAAGLPGAPLVTAAEVAGDLWLQVHRYEDARRAYAEAAERFGATLRILAGRARAARGLNDVAGACEEYRALLDAWGARPGLPLEIAEGRVYVAGFCASRGP